MLMALRHRERTGEGQLIEMPLTEGFLPTLGEFIMEYTMNGRDTPTQGNRHRWHAPHNVYPCCGDDNASRLAIVIPCGAQLPQRFGETSGQDRQRQHVSALFS